MKITIALLTQFVKLIINNATPMLVEFLREQALELRRKAKDTSNEWDDILANALCALLGIE